MPLATQKLHLGDLVALCVEDDGHYAKEGKRG